MPPIVRKLFSRVIPLSPRREVTARRQLQMAADIRRKLVDQFNGFYRLKNGEGT